MQQRIRRLEKQVGIEYTFDAIIGSSAVIKDAIHLAAKVSSIDTTVLLLGGNGYGQRSVCAGYSRGGTHQQTIFVAVVQCYSARITGKRNVGHKAGAYTGALKDKKGLMEEASKGTFFLDEIGEMPWNCKVSYCVYWKPESLLK